MSTTKTVTNAQFSVNYRDLLRGLLVSVGTAVFTSVLDYLNAGNINLDWKQIGIIALTAGLSYVVKNFFTPTEIVVSNPPQTAVNQVKEGAPIQVAGNTIAKKDV